MRIPAPNYTQTPNVFFDEIMRNLTDGELRVMMIIMRQTFGWHKNWDHITLNQMAEKTGYDRRSVARILANLIEKKLISKRKTGAVGAQKCYYSLVTEPVEKEIVNDDDGVETEEDEVEFKKVYTSDPRVIPPVTLQSPPPSDPRVTLQKKDLTKEKQLLQKKGAPPLPSAPPPAPQAVVFLKEKVNKLLEEEKELSESDRRDLLRYPPERIIAAFEFAALVPPKTTLAQELKWHCSEKVPPIASDKATNPQKFKKIYDDCKRIEKETHSLKASFYVHEDCVEFCHGTSVVKVPFSQQEAKERIKQLLKFYEFKRS